MIRVPHLFTRTCTLFSYTSLFRTNMLRNRRSGGNLAAGFCFLERRGRRNLCGHLREEHRLISLRSLLEFFSEKQRPCERQADKKDDSDNAEKNVGHIYPWLRSEEHTSELQSLMRISYAVFCVQKKKNTN